MKFFTRVKLVVMLSVLMVMLAGSAWAASLSIEIDAKLDETGKVLTVTESYFQDGKPYDDGYNPNPAMMARIGEGLLLKIGIRPIGTGTFQTYFSDSPIKFDAPYEQATFTLPTELAEGEYEFANGRDGHNTVVKTDTTPYYSEEDEAWEAFIQKMETEFGKPAIEEFLARLEYVENLYKSQGVNRSSTFTIVKESGNTAPGAPTNVTATAGDKQATVRSRLRHF